MMNNQDVKQIAIKFTEQFAHIANVGAKNIFDWEIDCNDLTQNFINEDIRDSEKFSNIFSELQNINLSPCIYYFEIISEISAQDILVAFKKVEGKIKPAIRSSNPVNSRILYVGKTNSKFWGRLIMHFGFHTNKGGSLSPTHGLQLSHWAKDIGLKLKLRVLEFDYESTNLMEILETKFAKELNPIIGKHR